MVEHMLTIIKNVLSFSGQERFYYKSHFQAANIQGNLGKSYLYRTLVKNAYQNIMFTIYQPKNM